MPIQKLQVNRNQVIDGTVDDFESGTATATATDFATIENKNDWDKLNKY